MTSYLISNYSEIFNYYIKAIEKKQSKKQPAYVLKLSGFWVEYLII